MAVAEGHRGKVQVTTAATSENTVAELREWRITGASRNVITYTAFGDTVTNKKMGAYNPGTLTFSGYFDGTDSTGQVELINTLTDGQKIGNSCTGVTDMSTTIKKLRLWMNDDTGYSNYGYWSCTGSSGAIYINGIDVSINTDGLGEITFSGEITDGAIEWSTA